MSILPADNTQRFSSQQVSSLERETPAFPYSTATPGAQTSRQIGQELGKISADSSAIKIDNPSSQINDKIRDSLKTSTLGDLLYNAPAAFFMNLQMLELTSKPTSLVESRENAIVSMLATLVLLSLGAEPSLLEGVKVKVPVLKEDVWQDQDISLKEHYTTYPVKHTANTMIVETPKKVEGQPLAEAKVSFNTDSNGAVTELFGTYKPPKSSTIKDIAYPPLITHLTAH